VTDGDVEISLSWVVTQLGILQGMMEEERAKKMPTHARKKSVKVI